MNKTKPITTSHSIGKPTDQASKQVIQIKRVNNQFKNDAILSTACCMNTSFASDWENEITAKNPSQ